MWPSLQTALAALAVCTGCLSTPPPAGSDDANSNDAPTNDAPIHDASSTDALVNGLLSPLTIEMLSSTRRRISNGLYSMILNSTAPRAPSEIRSVGGSNLNLLFTGPTGKVERYSGVELWPAWFSYAADMDLSTTDEALGPAVMRIHVDGRDTGMAVATTYTLHPDGRIHRWDRLTFTSVMSGWLVSYVSLDCTRIDGVSWAFEGGPSGSAALEPSNCLAMSEFQTGTGAQSLGHVCAYSTTGNDVVGWGHHREGIGSGYPNHLRIARTNQTVSLTSDWLRDMTPNMGPEAYAGHFLTVVNNLVGNTGGNCERVIPHIASFQRPLTLSVTGPAMLVTDGAGDDDTDGYNEGGGFYQIHASAGAVSLTASGTAVSVSQTFLVENFTATSPPMIMLGGQTLELGTDYLYQETTAGGAMWLHLAREIGTDTLVMSEGSSASPSP